MNYLINILLIPFHIKIKGLTTKAEIRLVNAVTTKVTISKEKHTVTICIPNSIFKGTKIRPSPNNPSRIKQKPRTNLNSLTTRKQTNRDKRIISRYVITNVFVSA